MLKAAERFAGCIDGYFGPNKKYDVPGREKWGVPTPERIAWHEMELTMFIHY